MKNAMRLLSVVAIGSVLLTGSAGATDYYWTNTVPGIWGDGFSWSPLGIPGAADSGRFTSNATVHVTLTSNTTSTLLFGGFSKTTFDLGGYTFIRNTGAPNFDLTDDARWTMTNGVLISQKQVNMGYGGDYISKTSTVTVGQGAFFQQTNAPLVVGYRYRSQFNVVDGGRLETYSPGGVFIGRSEAPYNGTGVMDVSGAGSTWTNLTTGPSASLIYVGYNGGTGTIRIANGGRVIQQGYTMTFGDTAGGVGSLLVESGGVLDMSGALNSARLQIGSATGTGSALITGAGSEIRTGSNTNLIYLGNTAGSQGSLVVQNGGALIHNGSHIRIGADGLGSLLVTNGGIATATNVTTNALLYVSDGAVSKGTLIVSGTDSIFRWGTNGRTNSVYLGNNVGAQGALIVEDHGTFVHQGYNLYLGGSGTGNVLVSSAGLFDATAMDTNANVYVGHGNGSKGTATVTGASSELRIGTLARNNSIYVGYNVSAQGVLNIADGGKVFYEGANVAVGGYGTGAVNVVSGGSLVITNPSYAALYIGRYSGGVGSVLVSGSNSVIDLGVSKVETYVGGSVLGASGTMILENGGTFYQGSNSTYVGYASRSATMIIRDGGVFAAKSGFGGFSVGGNATGGAYGYGTMIVTGANSSALIGDLNIGYSISTGVVTIADGGNIEVFRHVQIGGARTNAAANYNADGLLRVTGTGSVFQRTALTIAEAPLARIDTQSGLGISGGIWSAAAWDANGLVLASDTFARGGHGVMIVEKGGLVNMKNGMIAVFTNGTIEINGGHVIGYNIGMETGATFRATLTLADANASQALMTASNEVRIWGAALNVALGDDFVYHYEDTYRLIGFSTLNAGANRFDGIDHLDVITAGGVDFEIDYGVYDPGYITLMAIPEPGSLGLIGAGIGLAALLRRRRG